MVYFRKRRFLAAWVILFLFAPFQASSQQSGKSPEIPLQQNDRFTLVVLPDTQWYSYQYPYLFDAQTDWIVQNRVARNIVFVTHEGDIVEWHDDQTQWARASQSMGRLDGIVPYGVLPGNTDMKRPFGDTSNFNQYFSPTRFDQEPWYGGSYPAGTNDNSYQFFTGGGEGYLILHLMYCPMPDVLQWAEGVLIANADRRAIIVTHAYLDKTGNRNTVEAWLGCTSQVNNTEYIWDGLAELHPNVFLILNGHEWYPDQMEVVRTDLNAAGLPVYQIGANYQGRPNGGDGWLRFLEFRPTEGRICVRTFSPWLNQYETDADSDFALSYSAGRSSGRSDACEPEPPPPAVRIYLPILRIGS